MSFYISPFNHRTRRMIERMLDTEWPEIDRSPNIFFPVDIKTEEEAFVITALLPGIKAEDLNIQVVNETVSIQGEMEADKSENGNYLMQERPSGKFCRTLTLPEPLDFSKAEAQLTNGVLTLRIPKAEEARPKTIKVITK